MSIFDFIHEFSFYNGQSNIQFGSVIAAAFLTSYRSRPPLLILFYQQFINYSRKKSLSELQAQKTNVHKNEEGIENYGMMESEEEVTDMQFFARNAKKSMDESYATAEEMKANYLALLRYFGEDENLPSGNFFATLNRFLESFDSALDAVNKAEQARVSTLASSLGDRYICSLYTMCCMRLLAGVPRSYVTVTDKLSSFDSLTHYSQLKEEKRQKAKEMKEKMRSTMKKGAAAIQQAAKKPPNLQDILKKRNAVGNNEDGGESTFKPTLAGAAAAALAQTKNKARESMAQLQKIGSKDERSADATDDNDNTAQNPRLALMNSLRRRTPTPTSEVSEHVASADPRAALMGAIRSKSKGATDSVSEEEITFVDDSLSGGIGEASEDDDNEDQSSTPLNPRAAMLSAIKKKKNTKGTSNALGKSDAKQINTSDDPRSALLSAIKSKKKGDGDSSVTNNANSSELACIANRNLRSRGNSTSDSREDGDNAASPVHVDNAEDAVDKKELELSESVANRMEQTDDLLVRRSMRIVWRLLVLNACFVVAHMKYTSLHVVCLFCAFIYWWCYMYRITGTI